MTYAEVLSTDDVVRFDKGATGFLDLFTTVNQHQLNVFQPIFAAAGEDAQLMFVNILELAKFATASEITVRQNERLMKLGRANMTNAFESSAVILNQQAIRHTGRALKFVNEIREGLRSAPSETPPQFRILPEQRSSEAPTLPNEPRRVIELREVGNIPEFSEALTDAKEAFLYTALQLNFTKNDDFMEILEIWDNTMSLAHSGGVAGVLANMADSLEQFIARRGTEERGTSPASPLEWWKWVVIALYVGAAVFAVIACFWWFGCSWVWQAISATAPWIFKIVEMGC